ncbi:hypothetical protein GLAREA_02314 [Glarea lozoyensis ATCC 20868]|uniref:Uncharacterized protein n=1 Tax=Glarea lozoyensis (strain ATCC 20868 / MF5171) TaxID=1116229 RepID=S3D2X5_GLAL2|nr:uncharacterized protein GLAREA_02314 [Glarea lozoyensis ATCC 20868]EPE26401.1 hypothetical protein GLAREA_02314 [Glarea lozoyensis ATCC 20868]
MDGRDLNVGSSPAIFNPFRYLLNSPDEEDPRIDYLKRVGHGSDEWHIQQNKHKNFQLFPKFPTELKLRVLHFSMPGPCLIRIRSKYRTVDRKKV